ncbi:unnamed protein product [Acanthosepion pharaonis]|uniref:Uncharacterized protein n=1 Tax=Acanthosepion pharaonis TaxID=158019 RepID=A0A812BI84_ACAPH|nr:unnamed protein product [Sepia pharaonis]
MITVKANDKGMRHDGGVPRDCWFKDSFFILFFLLCFCRLFTDIMAFSGDLKVVKVGDIDAPPEEQNYLWPDTSTSESTEIALDLFTWKSTSQHPVYSGGWNVYHNDDLVKPVSEEVELPEESGAPDNWPQIPQLSRRRSSDRRLSICDADPKDKDALVPVTTDIVPLASVEALKDYNSHDQLKAVVKEVMLLLAWLHDDCQRTEAKLQSEKALATQLSLKIDEMSRRKLTDITNAVQKEHDIFKQKNRPCLVHLTYLNRIHTTCHNKLKSAQNLNFHLKKDIAIRNEQIPLVQEKILLEKQHIDKLQNDLNEAEQKMSETLKNQAETMSKHKEALEIIKQEQYLLDQQINSVCHELNKVSNAAEEAEKNYYMMSQGIVDGKQHIQDNEKEELVLKVKLENSLTKSNTLQIQNKEEKNILKQHLKTTKQIKSENQKIEDEIEGMKNEFNTKKVKIDKEHLSLEHDLQSLIDNNYAKNSKIESVQLQIEECKKQKSFYEKNLKRITHELMKNENQIALTLEELKRMQEVNKMLDVALEKEQLKNMEKEKALEQTIQQIRKEIDSENKAYLDMTTQIQDLEFELRNVKAEAEEEKEKLLFMVSEAKSALQKLEDKIKKLSNLKQQKIQALDILEKKKISIKEEFDKLIQDNETYLDTLTPFKDMSEQGNALESALAKLDEENVKLQDILEELNIQLEIVSKSSLDFRARREQVIEQLNQERREHDDLMHYRKEVLQNILEKKLQSLEENEELASKYRIAQNTLEQRKNEYAQLSEETGLLKQAVRDLKQLLKLQTKMEHNCTHYFLYRGLFHSKQLAYFFSLFFFLSISMSFLFFSRHKHHFVHCQSVIEVYTFFLSCFVFFFPSFSSVDSSVCNRDVHFLLLLKTARLATGMYTFFFF